MSQFFMQDKVQYKFLLLFINIFILFTTVIERLVMIK